MKPSVLEQIDPSRATTYPDRWVVSLSDASEKENGIRVLRNSHSRTLWLHRNPSATRPEYAADASMAVVFDGVLNDASPLLDGDSNGGHGGPPLQPGKIATLILQAYRKHGEDVLRKIKGIYALILWDAERDILIAARDPLGNYALFHSRNGSEIFLSTSIEDLRKHPRVSSEVNRVALANHLSHRWTSPEETFLAHVYRVPSTYAVRFSRGNRDLFQYWNPIPDKSRVNWVENEAEEVERALHKVVGGFLNHGPLAIFLSGGVDSVSIGAVAAKIAARDGLPTPLALSLIFPHYECNEEEVQRGVAGILNFPLQIMHLKDAVGREGLLSSAVELSRNWPQPLLSPWRPAYLHLALEGKRQGYRGILTGSGGDDWLTINQYYAADLIRTLSPLRLYWLLQCILRSHNLPTAAVLRYTLWVAGLRILLRMYGSRVLNRMAPGLLSGRALRKAKQNRPSWVAPDPALQSELNSRLEADFQRPRKPDPVGTHGFYFKNNPEGFTFPLRSLDMEEDFEVGQRSGMELFMPYWDADLVDLLCRVRPEVLATGARDKGLIRGMLNRTFPALGFIQRKKITALEFFQTIIKDEGSLALQRMGDRFTLVDLGVVDGKVIRQVLDSNLATDRPHDNHRIWEFLSLESWARSHA